MAFRICDIFEVWEVSSQPSFENKDWYSPEVLLRSFGASPKHTPLVLSEFEYCFKVSIVVGLGLREIKTIRHVIGLRVPLVQTGQAEQGFAKLHQADMRVQIPRNVTAFRI